MRLSFAHEVRLGMGGYKVIICDITGTGMGGYEAILFMITGTRDGRI